MSESKIEDIGTDDCVEDIGLDDWVANIDTDDYYEDSSEGDTNVVWNLEDYPIPESAELGSIFPNIRKALGLMGFRGSTEILAFADHLKYDIDKLGEAGIFCSENSEYVEWDFRSAVYVMPLNMILHAKSRAQASRAPHRASFLVIAKQSPGSELHRVQQCLKSRNHTVHVVDDPSKQCLFRSAESVVDCTHVFGEGKRKMTSAKSVVERAFLFRPDKPISDTRFAELVLRCRDIYGGGYSSAYEDCVSYVCRTIARCQKLCLEYISALIQDIRPAPEEFYHLIYELLRERGFRLNLTLQEDTTEKSPFDSVESRPPSLVEPTQVLGEGKYISISLARQFLGEEKPISKSLARRDSQFDISKIEDFSEPVTPVDTVVFWDVLSCPFPLCSDPDEIYCRIYNALRKMGCGSEMTIWAYVDENNGPWSGEHLRNKTWAERIYFLPGGDKASRCQRMLNDILLWEMDMLSPVDDPYTTDVIVVSDQVREDALFLRILDCMSTTPFNDFNVFLVTPPQHVNRPESLEWPGLVLSRGGWIGSTSKSSEPNPKKHKPDSAEVTVPEGMDRNMSTS